jgi:hypothetical protein
MKKSFCNVKKMRPFNRSIFVIIGFIVQKKVHTPMCTFNEIGVVCLNQVRLSLLVKTE